MCKKMLITAIIAVLVSCSSDKSTSPPPIDPGVTHAGYYVSVNGSKTGDGSTANPWDLQTALAQPAAVQPGDTIWIRGGTYKGLFQSILSGNPAAPIVLRQFPGERATIDGKLTVAGQYAYYWGFELMSSDPVRVTSLAGSDPADVPRQEMTILVTGPFNKLINLVLHDLGDGLYSGWSAQGLEVYGTLVYNNGWIGPDRGHGHGLYLQNQFEAKNIIDNVIFDNFSTNFKIGGSAGYLINFNVEGNSIFLAGAPALASFPYQRNVDNEGGAAAGNTVYDRNSIFHISGRSAGVRLGIIGDPAEPYPMTFTNNIVQGTIETDTWPALTFKGNKVSGGPVPWVLFGYRLLTITLPSGVSASSYNVDQNQYAHQWTSTDPPFNLALYSPTRIETPYSTLPSWQSVTGWDANSTLATAAPSGLDVIVRPNRYEKGRATVTVWNWAGASSANVDVSGVLSAGDKYTVHHVYDVFGSPVASGTYSGGSVSVPLRSYTPPAPIGMSVTPPSTGAQFNVFLIRKTS